MYNFTRTVSQIISLGPAEEQIIELARSVSSLPLVVLSLKLCQLNLLKPSRMILCAGARALGRERGRHVHYKAAGVDLHSTPQPPPRPPSARECFLWIFSLESIALALLYLSFVLSLPSSPQCLPQFYAHSRWKGESVSSSVRSPGKYVASISTHSFHFANGESWQTLLRLESWDQLSDSQRRNHLAHVQYLNIVCVRRIHVCS